MNAPTKVVGFVLGVALAFLVAYAVGSQVGPVGEPAEAAGHSDGGHSAEEGHSDAAATRTGATLRKRARRRLHFPVG